MEGVPLRSFPNTDGMSIVLAAVSAIQQDKERLCDLDGATGDGDHGINMNKGFTLCAEALAASPKDFSGSLLQLSGILMRDIGGSMGPLYGSFFRAMGRTCLEAPDIDGALFLSMLEKGEQAVLSIGQAHRGDKTMLDCLGPALDAFRIALDGGETFPSALLRMKAAAACGRDATYDMLARVGRASRLGERSRGHIDAGAASCCTILCAMADGIALRLQP